MNYKNTEKEIIRAMVKADGKVKSLAKVINDSHLLENKGIVIALDRNRNYVFSDKEKYDWDDKQVLGYIREFIDLIEHLTKERLITVVNYNEGETLVLGRKRAKYAKPGYIAIDDAMLEVESSMGDWIGKNNQQAYWPACYSEQTLPISKFLDCSFIVSQELKDLINNNFKSEEQIRFDKQQRLTWISIFVAVAIGVLSLVIGVIALFIR